jgi:hypothetical protein
MTQYSLAKSVVINYHKNGKALPRASLNPILHLLQERVSVIVTWEDTEVSYQHTSGVHTPVGDSDIRTQDFPSVRLPTESKRYPDLHSRWISYAGA